MAMLRRAASSNVNGSSIMLPDPQDADAKAEEWKRNTLVSDVLESKPAINFRLLAVGFFVFLLGWVSLKTISTGDMSGDINAQTQGGGLRHSSIDIDTDQKGYIVIIDAGSSGSRAHVFHYTKGGGSDGKVVVDPQHQSLKTTPGLSSYASTPNQAGPALTPLIDFAKEHVPPELWGSTKLILKATAGMRLLPKEQSSKVMENVQFNLGDRVFQFVKAEIIDGQEEGLLGWTAINYLNLLQQQQPQATPWGTLEMGGASIQLTLTVPDLDTVPQDLKRPYQYHGLKGQVFTHSFLGMGMTSARQAVNELLKEKQINLGSTPTDPCLQTGFTVPDDKRSALSGIPSTSASGDFNQCSKLLVEALYNEPAPNCSYPHGCLFNGMYAPQLSETQFWAFENFFYAPSALGVVVATKDEKHNSLKVQDFKSAGSQICSMGWQEMDSNYPKDDQPKSFNEMWCFGMSHIYNFLIHGLKFTDDQSLVVGNNVGPNGIDWALGAALQVVEST